MTDQPKPEGGEEEFPFYLGGPQPCSYLPNREARSLFTLSRGFPDSTYQVFMDAGFRRSGRVIYRPTCKDCSQCVPIRVPVDRFKPSRSQRRARKRNPDVLVETQSPVYTAEKWDLYSRYLAYQHGKPTSDDPETLREFLYSSPVTTWEMTYRVGQRMVGVGIVDVTPVALSSVYFYFDPEFARRSLGTFSALTEIDLCLQLSLSYWYIGFYVRDCLKMNYKANFWPHQFLNPEGSWIDAG